MSAPDLRATSGKVTIARGLFCDRTVYRWPITEPSMNCPAIDLIIRQRDDGEIVASVAEEWNLTHE